MKKLLLAALLLLASCTSSVVPPTPVFIRALLAPVPQSFGQDTLGAARYSQVSALSVQPGEGRGHFASTFGDIIPTLRAEIAQHVAFERIHLLWKDNHSFSMADFPVIVHEATRLCPIVQENPQVKWYFSGGCEHTLNQADARALALKVLAACPQVTYVNTPNGNQGAVLPEYINESHGGGRPKSTKFAFSCDGTACEDADVTTLKKDFAGAEYFLVWGPRYNGRWSTNDTTPRPNRQGWPDKPYVESMQYLTTDKGDTSLPPKYLWKSHAEMHGAGDTKGEHPVAIIPPKVNSIQLKRGNVVIENMKYYGPYLDGRSRYYSVRFGHQTGKVDLFVNGRKVGNINAGFRDGEYR